jgi:hypothetical protein
VLGPPLLQSASKNVATTLPVDHPMKAVMMMHMEGCIWIETLN